MGLVLPAAPSGPPWALSRPGDAASCPPLFPPVCTRSHGPVKGEGRSPRGGCTRTGKPRKGGVGGSAGGRESRGWAGARAAEVRAGDPNRASEVAFLGEAGGTWDFSRAVSAACGLMAKAGWAEVGWALMPRGGPAARARVLGSGQELGHNPAGQGNRGARGVLAALSPGKRGDPPRCGRVGDPRGPTGGGQSWKNPAESGKAAPSDAEMKRERLERQRKRQIKAKRERERKEK